MANIPAKYVEGLANKLFTKEQLAANKFYTVGNVPPMAIIRLSEQFGSLNLAKEDILFVYDNNLGIANKGFIVTSNNIHFIKGYMPLDDITQLFDEKGKLRPPFPDLSAEMKKKLTQFFQGIQAYDPKKDMNIAIFGKKEGDVNVTLGSLNVNSEGLTPEQGYEKDLVDAKFLHMLQHEVNTYLETCKELDKDTDFKKTVQKMANNTDIVINDPSAKELFTQDAIRLFNLCSNADREVTRREQFALVYLFERLVNDGDMAQSIKLDRINNMISNNEFQKNVKTLQEYEIFNVTGEFPNELLLPTILSKLDHDSFSSISTHLYRFASIILKADGKVTKEEESILKEVQKLINEPKKAIKNVKQIDVPKDETLDDVFKELNQLVGLKSIKEDINTLINFLKIQKVREEKGLATQSKALHTVFMGPPGTGKTTIARLVARIYKHVGFLERGHLVETDRAGLVAGYVGQTALKVDEVVKTALDGVLFIDEAYALARGGGDKRDFGHEAIEALLKRMEDHRKRLVVIVAGYPDEMETFIKSNPGLKSRFNRYFYFDHYNGKELLAIFKIFAKKADFKLEEDSEDKLSFIFDELYQKRTKFFGNARVARNLFDRCVERQANRIVSIAPLTEEILMTLTEEDIPPVKETIQNIMVFQQTKAKEDTGGQTDDMMKMMKNMSKMMAPGAEGDAGAGENGSPTPEVEAPKQVK